ncbi:MAG: CPBP family intramembrane metalloprotease [Clostridia bacterium]|nr:CPBP family intramembrane metalloprotease [Clostridia bacterium]
MDKFNRIEMADASAYNRKKAVFGMCRVSVLLLIITVLSECVSFSVFFLVGKYSQEIQRLLVKILVFFNASKGSAYTAVKLVMGSEAFSKVLGIAVTIVSLVIPGAVFAKAVKLSGKETFNISGKCIKGLIPMFCLCHLFTTLASVFSGAISDFLLPGSASVYEASTGVVAHEFNIYEFVISILCTSIFVPIVEEYVFRGVIFSYLRRFGTAFGIVASATIFGVAHTSPVQSVYAFVFGLFSATMIVVTGNIKTSILLHAGNNCLTVVLGYILGELNVTGFNVVSGLYMIIISGIAIYGLYSFCKEDGLLQNLRDKAEEQDGELVVKPGLGQIMVLPLVVYILYYAYSVLMTVM